MKGAQIKSFSIETIRVPFKRPFITALGRRTQTCNVGITLRLAGGFSGYGEASSSLAQAHLTPAALRRTLSSLGQVAVGKDASCPGGLIAEAWRRHGAVSPAAAAFECALLEAILACRGLTLAQYFGGSLRSLESAVTLSAWDDLTTSEAAKDASRDGFRVFKIKLEGNLSADIGRIRAARRSCPGSRFILDGNQGLTTASALRLVETCLKEETPIGLLEQPLPKTQYKEMAALSRRCPVPVAADEMVASPEDAVRVAAEGAARVINIKVAKSGLLRSLQIAAVARAAGMDLMIGCMAETARGLGASVHLALGTGFFRYVDLDSDYLLAPGGPYAARHRASGTLRSAAHGKCGGWLRRGSVLSLD